MLSTYRLHTDELDSHFVDALKTLFRDKTIEIVVTDVPDDELDETDYLMSTDANRDRLLAAIKNVKNGNGLVEVDLDTL